MTVMFIDAAQDLRPNLDAMINAGLKDAIRYDCRLVGGRWKEAGNAEWAALVAAGLHVGVVNEGIGNDPSAFDFDTGYADAAYSLARAAARNQDEGSAIYYAIDFDASYAETTSRIIPYFQGVAKAHGGNSRRWEVGAYASGLVCSTLLAQTVPLIKYPWITCSGGFSGSAQFVNAGREAIWQYACDRNWFGVSADFNTTPSGQWGQWPLVTPAPPSPIPIPVPAPAPIPSPPAWPTAYGPQQGKASWYDDSSNADGTPVNNDSDMSFASLHIPFGTKVRFTRLDNAADPWHLRTECDGLMRAWDAGQRSTVATCHDHGPYEAGRIIDCRPALAKVLGFGESYGEDDPGVIAIHMELV